jgi:hypothetical protein
MALNLIRRKASGKKDSMRVRRKVAQAIDALPDRGDKNNMFYYYYRGICEDWDDDYLASLVAD